MESNSLGGISYKEVRKEEQFFAKEVTLLMVLKGAIVLEDEGEAYHLAAGDIYLLNMNRFFIIKATSHSQSLLVFLAIDNLYFTSQFPKFYTTLFECHPRLSEQGKKEEMNILRKRLAEICLNEFSETDEKKIQSTVGVTQILLQIIRYFQKGQRQAAIGLENQKLQQILEYIENHYRSGITLKEVSDNFYLSESTLSKYFKKETGEYFSEFVKKLQVRHSLSDICYSQKSIEQVAQENGFNSGKIYREQFKRILEVSPTDYRKRYKGEQEKKQIQDQSEWVQKVDQNELVVILYGFIQATHEETVSQNLTVRRKRLLIEPSIERKPQKKLAIFIHVGSLTTLNERKIQEEIRQLKSQEMITHVSFYNLFAAISPLYSVSQKAHMNAYPPFSELETAVDFIRRENLQVLFTLQIVGSTKELEQSVRLYQTFFNDLQNRFGEEEMKRWSINIQLTKRSSKLSNSLYSEVRSVFKELSPFIKVGLEFLLLDPYTEQEARQGFFELTRGLQNQLDFLTYTVEPNFIFQEEGRKTLDLKEYHQYVQQKTLFIHSLVKEHHLSVPIYLAEWNTLTGTTINMNGLFFRGALVLQDLLQLEESVEGVGFWLNIEQLEKNRHLSPTKSEGLELFHFYSSRRPSYFCLSFVQRMKGMIVAQGDSYLLTQSGKDYQLLVWNANYFDPHLSSEEAFLKSQGLRLDVTIQQISGQYQIKQLELNRNSGALFYTYNEFQETKIIDYEIQEYTRTMTRPKMKVFDTTIHEQFTVYLTLDTNAVTLLELKALKE
ncbi:hypothetical protein IGI37_002906 [Enterococcus sp. AZ194]|uniref:helix-turn-helix domain-containing protein n=1 Tax=Enterococcus sp. AZ194 TaxID=2774629 RepID=UPI003F229730